MTRFLVTDGFAGSLSGVGDVYGTAGFQDITFSDGINVFTLDPSFNQGGDILRLPGDAGDYTIELSASTAVLASGASTYTIPVGPLGISIVFADGARDLRLDPATEEVTIGDQPVAASALPITAESGDPPVPGNLDPDAFGLGRLQAGSSVAVGGNWQVFATNGAEEVTWLGGELTLDPSFNRGGDVLVLGTPAWSWSAFLNGSTLVVLSDAGSASIPLGPAGITLDFAGEERLLTIDPVSSQVLLGEQIISATAAEEADVLGYSAVHVFGDSLIDAGNALALAEWYDGLPFSDLPDGAPTAELGYFEGRFSDGYTMADLVANRLLGTPTQPIFPYGYEDPVVGVPIDPFEDEPTDNNLNWAYGGAQIIMGGEAVPDLDGQTDAFRDAVDGEADPHALYFVTIGGNDVRDLVPATGDVTGEEDARADLKAAAEELLDELSQLVSIGGQHILIAGIPDVGIIPRYDTNGNGVLDTDPLDGPDGTEPSELARSETATAYSAYLDDLVRSEVLPALAEQGARVTYVPLANVTDDFGAVTSEGALPLVLPVLAALNGLETGALAEDILAYRDLVFFDDVHPTAQVHALVAAQIDAALTGMPASEILPLSGENVMFSEVGAIELAGEVDELIVDLVAGTTYTFEVLGVSSLGEAGSLADPALMVLGPDGNVIDTFAAGSGNDAGPGLDANVSFTAGESGAYAFLVSGVGAVTGTYLFQGGVVPDSALFVV